VKKAEGRPEFFQVKGCVVGWRGRAVSVYKGVKRPGRARIGTTEMRRGRGERERSALMGF
jgi:hypothetical protein